MELRSRFSVVGLAVVLVAATFLLVRQFTVASADNPDAEMALSVKSPTGVCDDAQQPATCDLDLGQQFTLSVEVVTAPANGYVLAQGWIDYANYDPTASEDGAGADTCGDGEDNGSDGADRLDTDCVRVDLVYKPAETAADEIVWPDLADATALRGNPPIIRRDEETFEVPGAVNLGGLTALIPPLPVSNYTGNIVELAFGCSAGDSTTQVDLLPSGDLVAGTDGALFVEADGIVQVVPKVDSLIVNCGEGAALPPPPPTAVAGGTAANQDQTGLPLETPGSSGPDSSGGNVSVLVGVAAAVAAGVIAVGGAAWYARRRWQK